MTHYSDRPGHVRVDFFTPSGKWKYNFRLDMSEFYDEPSIYGAVEGALSMDDHLGRPTPVGVYEYPWWMTWEGPIVVLEPYHKHAHPILIQPHLNLLEGERS